MNNAIDLTDRHNSFYWQSDRAMSEVQIKISFLDRHKLFDPVETKAAIEYGMQQYGKSATDAKVVFLDNPIKSGSINSVCKATLSDGTSVIIRMHPKKILNGYFWVEKTASEIAKKNKIPAFTTYFIDDSMKKFPFSFMIIEVLKGDNMKNSGPFEKIINNKLVEETGKYMALIHQIKVNQYGFFDNKIAKEKNSLVGIHTKWDSHVFAALNDNLNYLIKMNMISESQQENILAIFEQNKKIIQCTSPRLIHNDIADWNQLTDGTHITGILDWDECFSGDPVCDFSTWSVFFDFDRMENLKKGYKTIASLPQDFEEKFHLYRLRYIISKMTLRTKRSVYDKSEFITTMLAYSQKILIDESKWYGI